MHTSSSLVEALVRSFNNHDNHGGALKSLILYVDRDNDVGDKAGIETPVIGRRGIVAAAQALGLADPEDSDTNALFAAARLYDQELARGKETGDQVEVAALAGHRRVGLRSDRILAAQLDQVLAATGADDVILVTDGAEDEQILPIIQSRVPVSHMYRSIVKQAPRLEGAYYTITRMMDDDKMARRFVMPIGIVMLVWAFAFLTDMVAYAWGVTLGIAGAWLLVHALRWEQPLGRFARDFMEGLRSGRVQLLANIGMVILLAWGAVAAFNVPSLANATRLHHTLRVLDVLLPFVISALLVYIGGAILDGWLRTGGARIRTWTAAFMLIAFGFLASAGLDAWIGTIEGLAVARILTFDLVLRVFVGLSVGAAGLIVSRYVRSFVDGPTVIRRA